LGQFYVSLYVSIIILNEIHLWQLFFQIVERLLLFCSSDQTENYVINKKQFLESLAKSGFGGSDVVKRNCWCRRITCHFNSSHLSTIDCIIMWNWRINEWQELLFWSTCIYLHDMGEQIFIAGTFKIGEISVGRHILSSGCMTSARLMKRKSQISYIFSHVSSTIEVHINKWSIS
jgi:hypothetical protein